MNNQKKKILLIEDEPALQEAIKMKMEQKGIEVCAFDTGETALEFLKKEKPDLVWLDVLLPGINGLEVLKRIRENEKIKDLPIVIVSVSAGPEKIKKAFSYNVIDYIIKSEYTIDNIVKKVKGIMDSI
jgi:DNA-binding response OmpR family regulator